MAGSLKDKHLFTMTKGIMDHTLWQRWQQTIDEKFQPNLLSIDELIEFASQHGVEQVDILYDVDGARCRLTGRLFHIHKIADTAYTALVLAIADLEKEVYEYEFNRSNSCS